METLTLLLTIVNIEADTSHVESLTIADASEIDGILASRDGYLVDDPTFTIDDDAVTYHATITI
jgi:hypothetical protein